MPLPWRVEVGASGPGAVSKDAKKPMAGIAYQAFGGAVVTGAATSMGFNMVEAACNKKR